FPAQESTKLEQISDRASQRANPGQSPALHWRDRRSRHIREGGLKMLNSVRTLAATAMLAAGIASLASGASAMPIAHGLALQNAAPTSIETVQWRGRGWGGRGWGGAGAGFVAGAIIVGAIAAPYYYGP